MHWKRYFALLLSVVLATPSCTTLRNVPLREISAETIAQQVQRGDVVHVYLNSGEEKEFKVTSVGTDALLGKNERVPFADIQSLQKRKVSAGKNALVIVGVVITAALVWIAGMWASATTPEN
jgi:hypothetical protein